MEIGLLKDYIWKILSVLFQIVYTIDCGTLCPLRFPYAYNQGLHCCRYNMEKPTYEYLGDYQDGFCNGNKISLESKCCKDDQYRKCFGQICETPSFENDPCPDDFPFPYFHGLYCCKTSKEKAMFNDRQRLNFSCQGANLSLESECCQDDQFIECVNPPCVAMGYWSLTWNAEGNDNPNDSHFSRKLRVPLDRGITLGRGYDMKGRFAPFILMNLQSIGVSNTKATIISQGEQKTGFEAERFITDNNLQDYTITHKEQWNLFKLTVNAYEDEAKSVYSDFQSKHFAIKGIVIDLMIRYDFTANSRNLIDSTVISNEARALKEIMRNRSNWLSVPQDRFDLRKAYMDKYAV